MDLENIIELESFERDLLIENRPLKFLPYCIDVSYWSDFNGCIETVHKSSKQASRVLFSFYLDSGALFFILKTWKNIVVS